MRMLIIEDDPATQDGMKAMASLLGDEPYVAGSGAEALSLADSVRPDLILLDVMLPDGLGTDVLAKLRQKPATRAVPVMMISSVQEIDTKLRAFDLGIDDYICKPVDLRELIQRVGVIRRRQRNESPRMLAIGSARYDEIEKTLLLADGRSIVLTLNEDRLFRALAQSLDKTVPREDLFEKIWSGRKVGPRNLDTLVIYLRRKLTDTGLLVESEVGVGYRLFHST